MQGARGRRHPRPAESQRDPPSREGRSPQPVRAQYGPRRGCTLSAVTLPAPFGIGYDRAPGPPAHPLSGKRTQFCGEKVQVCVALPRS